MVGSVRRAEDDLDDVEDGQPLALQDCLGDMRQVALERGAFNEHARTPEPKRGADGFIGSAGVRLMTAHQNVSVRCCRVRLGACLSSFFFGETQLVAEIQSTENACFDQQMTRLRKHYRPRQRGLPKGL